MIPQLLEPYNWPRNLKYFLGGWGGGSMLTNLYSPPAPLSKAPKAINLKSLQRVLAGEAEGADEKSNPQLMIGLASTSL